MTHTTHPFKTSSTLIKTATLIAAVATMSLPVFAYAASYAYVDQLGEVKMVIADGSMVAIATAPNIDEHSGVMLLTGQNSGIVGDRVSGM